VGARAPAHDKIVGPLTPCSQKGPLLEHIPRYPRRPQPATGQPGSPPRAGSGPALGGDMAGTPGARAMDASRARPGRDGRPARRARAARGVGRVGRRCICPNGARQCRSRHESHLGRAPRVAAAPIEWAAGCADRFHNGRAGACARSGLQRAALLHGSPDPGSAIQHNLARPPVGCKPRADGGDRHGPPVRAPPRAARDGPGDHGPASRRRGGARRAAPTG